MAKGLQWPAWAPVLKDAPEFDASPNNANWQVARPQQPYGAYGLLLWRFGNISLFEESASVTAEWRSGAPLNQQIVDLAYNIQSWIIQATINGASIESPPVTLGQNIYREAVMTELGTSTDDAWIPAPRRWGGEVTRFGIESRNAVIEHEKVFETDPFFLTARLAATVPFVISSGFADRIPRIGFQYELSAVAGQFQNGVFSVGLDAAENPPQTEDDPGINWHGLWVAMIKNIPDANWSDVKITVSPSAWWHEMN